MVNACIQTTVSIGPGLYQRGPDEVGRERLAGSVLHLGVRLPQAGLSCIGVRGVVVPGGLR